MADSDFDFDAPTTLRDGEGEADSIDDALFGEPAAVVGPTGSANGRQPFSQPSRPTAAP